MLLFVAFLLFAVILLLNLLIAQMAETYTSAVHDGTRLWRYQFARYILYTEMMWPGKSTRAGVKDTIREYEPGQHRYYQVRPVLRSAASGYVTTLRVAEGGVKARSPDSVGGGDEGRGEGTQVELYLEMSGSGHEEG